MEQATPGAEDADHGKKRLEDFKRLYGEDFDRTIDLDTWQGGMNLSELYPRIESELIQAKWDELEIHKAYREEIFPKLENRAVPFAGLHSDVSLELIEKVHRGFLFNGAVTASGSLRTVYDSVPISITQLGVCLVNYQGRHGSYSHQLFRRDLRHKNDDHLNQAIELLHTRHNEDDGRLSSLALRGIQTFAERSILLERSGSNWLMGSGSPTPFELMTGFWASYPDMKNKSIGLMERMIVEHERFVYVQESRRNPQLWTFGNALKPFEYLVVDTMESKLRQVVDTGNTRTGIREDYEKFADEVGPKIAYGVYSISRLAPPQIFYCHVDHIETAVLVAMADSALQMHSGVPMLLGLADSLCKNAFGKSDFMASIDQAYTRAEVLTKLQANYGE